MFKLYGKTKYASFQQTFLDYHQMVEKQKELLEQGWEVWYDFDVTRVLS